MLTCRRKDVDARDKRGHDGAEIIDFIATPYSHPTCAKTALPKVPAQIWNLIRATGNRESVNLTARIGEASSGVEGRSEKS
jgi:hypothetical protein